MKPNQTKRRLPKPVYATKPAVCRACWQPIRVGTRISRRQAGAVYHHACLRLQVRPGNDTKTRFLVGNPIGKPCAGCQAPIEAGDQYLHVMAVLYHRECRP
jgi:hypothetical protein